MEKAVDKLFSFDDFQIDATKRLLLRSGRPVSLKPKAFDLLMTLVEHRGQVLTKNELLEKIWADQFVEENNLTVHVAALRKALGEGAKEHRFIATVPGQGYAFVAELKSPNIGAVTDNQLVQRAAVAEAEIVASDNRAALADAPSSNTTRRNWLLTVVAIVLVAAVIGGLSFFLHRKESSSFASAAGFSIKQLTSSGTVYLAALSPDAKSFAYVLDNGAAQHSLWLGHVDGGQPQELLSSVDVFIGLSFSPDGSTLFYTTTSADRRNPSGELRKMPSFGGVPERIRDNIKTPIALSADGKTFVFVRDDVAVGSSTLIIDDLNSKQQRALLQRPLTRRFSEYSPSWSPDGTEIVFGAIVDDAATLQLFTVTVSDSNVRPLSSSSWNFIRSTTWLNDARGLLLVGQEKGLDDARWQVYHVSYPEGAVRQFNPDLGSYGSSIDLSADGKTLLAIQDRLMSNVWIAPVGDLSKARQITFGSFERLDGWFGLDWLPNGKIAYTAVVEKGKTIFMMDAGGSNQKQLIPNGGENLYPSVSDDNRYLVFQSNRNGKYEVWRADSVTGDLRSVTNVDVAAQPHISPDGKWIVYVSDPKEFGTLYRISSDGGEATRLTEKPAKWARVSPDSKFVACGYYDSGTQKIAIIPISGGEPVLVFDTPPAANLGLGVRWTHDGKAVAYRDWVDGIWLQSLTADSPARLKGLPHEKLYAFDWSADGKFLAFTRGTQTRDVVLISAER